ncbi:MAG: nucleotidyltransferase domain-containing protein [archaeon]|nr:nucleotidyltransferase domain-containing protein [archaeon]
MAKKTKKALKPGRIKIQSEKDIAFDFAASVHKHFDRMVKSIILFGSQAKNTAKTNSDIDIIIVIDDASIQWDLELISWYREELAKIINAKSYSKELHINTIKLTTWWQDLLHGDPVIINILRYGESLIDSGGFFSPIKALLEQGKIYSTPEAVYIALQRAPAHLARSKAAELGAIEGVYWTMIDSAQAALMTAGKLPPSPEHIPQMMEELFVAPGMINGVYVKWIKDVYNIHKKISHGEIRDVKGIHIDEMQANAEKFLAEMTRVIDYYLEKRAI